ncbi:hypothetical protein AURANDRAFT_51986 [Aureococcus anophagefferens]|uniref:Uncharacterized protein n=1 Tax=Aureococcus anophagefferens TaxID=44056 RepID=F0XVP7_AURAN|nr:hypothetical protein AURANDRAFT_51986 [Aureococcus anophagefferens]EGB12638.1 hypothetical protein AURANDRAFT_51986 [Aureococcus anophagefferens]|eukprot:XP_009032299.1 hypothetical protein AURANDRAFT_51986 [Aureococcus anophagefferens]
MFIYLSKSASRGVRRAPPLPPRRPTASPPTAEIAIPNGVVLHSLAWNPDHGWIASGGDDGLLKVLKLDSPRDVGKAPGGSVPSNLSMNQTLEGHHGSVMCVTWNANYRKLTTSDQNGLIIVWMLHKGVWFEEMINNRNKSVVRAMKWTADGQKICIVYEDGAVIVGSVDGNRLWGKDLTCGLTNVEWSPDANYILFVTSDSELHMYDLMGSKVKTIPTGGDGGGKRSRDGSATIIGVHWYDGMEGYTDPNAPTLAVAFGNGRVQLMRGSEDAEPVVVESDLRLRQCKWNTRGTVLALAGTLAPSGSDQREDSVVQFFSPYGKKLRSLKVPGGGINALSWEGGGLRIALAVDAYIYFANIRPDYKWGYFAGDTVVVAYSPPERSGTAVVFWDTKTNEKVKKRANGLRAIKAVGEHCMMVCEERSPADETQVSYRVSLRNAIGAPVESRLSPVEPVHAAMTHHYAIVASDRHVYVWQFAKLQAKLAGKAKAKGEAAADLISLRQSTGRERVLDVAAPSADAVVMVEQFKPPPRDRDGPGDGVSDPIAAVAASDRLLLVARASGDIFQYSLPHVSLERKHGVSSVPWILSLNCASSKLAIIDTHGRLAGRGKKCPTSKAPLSAAGELLNFERKDCWDVVWAEDDPDLFVAMEKTRLCVYGADLEPEEPIVCSGYVASFKSLKVTSVVLEHVAQNPEKVTRDVVVVNETSSLREVRDVLQQSGSAEGYMCVEQRPHPHLWRFLAESALEALDLTYADKAFVRCHDYQGIQFVKRLRGLSDRMKQRAEVAAFFGRFDEAEQIYREIDRKDLAIELRVRLGDWARVSHLVQSGGGDDKQLASAYCKLGDHYALRSFWEFRTLFLPRRQDKMAECYYRLGDFAALEALAGAVPQGAPLLLDLGRKFESVGLHAPAVEAYLRAGEPKAAIDCCVLLNQWEKAVEIAEEFGFQQIEGLLAKYAAALLQRGDRLLAAPLSAVLYRKANKATDAAKLLAAIAEDVGVQQANPLRAKKLHVLAALEVERYRKKTLDLTATRGGDIAQTTAATLDTLMTHDQESGASGAKVLDNAWRGAAAYHYYVLAHKQLYAGSMDAATKTSIRLAEYEDVLPRRDIYSIVALAAYHSGDYDVCSRAFIKLETLDDLAEDEQDEIQRLALAIFSKKPPGEHSPLASCYIACLETGTPYHACTKTGRAVLDGRTLQCTTCRHHAFEAELSRDDNHCPLCHTVYPAQYRVA